LRLWATWEIQCSPEKRLFGDEELFKFALALSCEDDDCMLSVDIFDNEGGDDIVAFLMLSETLCIEVYW